MPSTHGKDLDEIKKGFGDLGLIRINTQHPLTVVVAHRPERTATHTPHADHQHLGRLGVLEREQRAPLILEPEAADRAEAEA